MSTKIIFRKGSVVPITEVLSVGEPMWDATTAKLGVGNGEQQPRWYPSLTVAGDLVLNPVAAFNSNFVPNSNKIYSNTKHGFVDFDDSIFRYWSNGTVVATFQDIGNVFYSHLSANAGLSAYGAIALPGFTIASDGTVTINGDLNILGGLNLSLAEFAAGIIPTTFNPGDLLVAGTPHTWKNPKTIVNGTALGLAIARSSGIVEDLRLDFGKRNYFSAAAAGLGFLYTTIQDIFDDGNISFTRSTTANYYDKKGVFQSAAINVVREDHDPYTGERLGILIEGPSKNWVLNSTDTSLWQLTGSGFDPITNAEWTAKGFANPGQFFETTDNSGHNIHQSFANLSTSQVISGSFMISLAPSNVRTSMAVTLEDTIGNNIFGTHLNLATMAVGNAIINGNGSLINAHFKRIGNGIYRVNLTGIINTSTGVALDNVTMRVSGTSALNGNLTYGGVGGPIAHISNFQIEIYDKVTSLIPTTGGPAMRGSDNFGIPTNKINFDPNVGTVDITVRPRTTQSAGAPILFFHAPGDATTYQELYLNSTKTPEILIQSGGAIKYQQTLGSLVLNQNNEFYWSYTLNGQVYAGKDGVNQNPAYITVLPASIDMIYVGRNYDGSKFFDGWITKLAYTSRKIAF